MGPACRSWDAGDPGSLMAAGTPLEGAKVCVFPCQAKSVEKTVSKTCLISSSLHLPLLSPCLSDAGGNGDFTEDSPEPGEGGGFSVAS